MAMEFVVGLPGGGKSYHGTRLVIQALRECRSRVCTNLALDLPRLREYLQEKYGESYDIENRLRILTRNEVGEFWLYRYLGIDIDPTKRIRAKMKSRDFELDVVDYESQNAIQYGPVVYVLEEIHNFFNARNYQKTGAEAVYYVSQHRKFGDTVICITQFSTKVDVTFRNLCERFYLCRNNKHRKLAGCFGLFKLPEVLMLQEFEDVTMKTCVSTKFFKLDVAGVASCYQTQAGVGFVGGAADTDVKPKGMPAWSFAVILAVLGFCLIKGSIWALRKVTAPKFARSGQKAVLPPSIVTNQIKTSIVPVAVTNSFPPPPPPRIVKDVVEPVPKSEEVFLTGINVIPRNGRKTVRIYLSDGSSFNDSDHDVQFIGKESVKIAGMIYTWPRKTPTHEYERQAFGRQIRPALAAAAK